jgi:hypothetical protein
VPGGRDPPATIRRMRRILTLTGLSLSTLFLLAWWGMSFSAHQQAEVVWCAVGQDPQYGDCGFTWVDWGSVLGFGLAVGGIAALLVIILWAAIRGAGANRTPDLQ